MLQAIDLKKLPTELGSTSEFLKAHLKGRVRTKGTQILVEGAKHREVKLILHKFIHHKSLEGYRVLSQAGVLQIIPPHLEEKRRQETGTPPPASYTMPYFLPSRPTPMPEEKRVSKRKRQSRKKTSRP